MKIRLNANRKAGSAMLVVMLFCAILMLSSAAILAMASNASFRMRRQLRDSQTLQIAEAGIADMIGRLSDNYEMWQDSTNQAVFAGGQYRVVSETTPNGSVIITSRGVIDSVSRIASVELLGTDRDHNDALFSLDGAILSGGDVRFNTAAFSIKGNVHSNTEVVTGGGNSAANADFLPADGAAEVFISAVGNVDSILTATRQENVAERELPQFNFDSYRQLAIDEGLYFENGQAWSAFRDFGANTYASGQGANRQEYIPSGTNRIIYVNGDVEISAGNWHGTLVVNGNVTLRNQYHQTANPGMPAILSTGSVDIGNRGTINGLIYAKLNVYVNNNVDLNGGIISGGYTEINNNTDVVHPSDSPDWDPLQPTIPPEVLVGGWLR